MNILKYIFFGLHIIFILSTLFLWIWYLEIIIIQLIVMISWLLNSNKCIFTQLEDYLFNHTLLECVTNRIIPNKSKFITPYYHRFSVFIIFVISIIYHIYIQIKILEELFQNFT